MQIDSSLLYISLVILLGLLVLMQVLFFLGKMRKKRREALNKKKKLLPVFTESPFDDPVSSAKKHGLKSIENQFSITRKMVIPTIFGIISMIAIIPFLNQIPAAFLSFFIAGLTVLLGIAAKPIVENGIAGLTVSFSKLINIGDTIKIDNMYGTVEDITITHTTIKLWDWRRYVIPNSQMISTNFISYSLFDQYIWTYVEFYVSYHADLKQVQQIAIDSSKESNHFAAYEDPQFWVLGMETHSYKHFLESSSPKTAPHISIDD